ncbi:hypothetical protein SVAN01_06420 [Stagonosporopsis vannaccii]|nr:hypothetical protein SVAN01_06420 [Stagonosporopsis vannaccii]
MFWSGAQATSQRSTTPRLWAPHASTSGQPPHLCILPSERTLGFVVYPYPTACQYE